MTDNEFLILTIVIQTIVFAAGYGFGALSRGGKLLKSMNRVADLEHRVFATTQFLVRIKQVLRPRGGRSEKTDLDNKYIVADIELIMKDVRPAWAGIFEVKS